MRIPLPWALAAVVLLAASAGGADECGGSAYDCALLHFGRRQYAEAIRDLDRALAASPRDLKALNLMGITLTASGRPKEANERFRAALAIDPAFTAARKNLAINEYDAGRLTASRAHLEQVLRAAPADEIAHIYMGEIESRAKRPAAAAEHYAKAGGRFAQSPIWTLHYGRALLDAGRSVDAIAVLDKLPGSEGAALFEGAVALGRSGHHAEAARLFAAARKTYADPYSAGFNEALMRIDAGDHDGAIRVVQELIAEGKAGAELYNLVSRAYVAAGRLQEAYDALRQAARLDPLAPENYVDLATIALEHESFDLGLEIVDIGLGRLPSSPILHLQRGVLLAMKGVLEDAEKEFETARRLDPSQSVSYAALAMVWMQSGQADKAVEVLRAELPRRRDHVVPYMFAVALLRSGVEAASAAGDEAMAALRKAIKANPRFAPAHAELGRLLLKRGETDLAVPELETATSLDPANTPALYALSQAYRKKGDGPRAQELLARVSKLNAEERGVDHEGEVRRAVVRIMREGAATAAPAKAGAPPPSQ